MRGELISAILAYYPLSTHIDYFFDYVKNNVSKFNLMYVGSDPKRFEGKSLYDFMYMALGERCAEIYKQFWEEEALLLGKGNPEKISERYRKQVLKVYGRDPGQDGKTPFYVFMFRTAIFMDEVQSLTLEVVRDNPHLLVRLRNQAAGFGKAVKEMRAMVTIKRKYPNYFVERFSGMLSTAEKHLDRLSL